ncbi:MAG: peptidoglycan glycosyltransferase [Lachnospiraceae bacterium]|nr:peptidoglycan glycosyltransferase [Lachnospiraceae bacterium]
MRRKRRTKRFNVVMKNSLYVAFIVVILLCIALTGRLVWINNKKGNEYGKKVLSQQAYSSRTIVAERGSITDRNGITIARSEKTYNVVLDPDVILSHDYYMKPTLEAMEECLGYNSEEMQKIINDNPKSRYLVFEKNIDYIKVSNFNKYKSSHKFVVGVWFEEEYTRVYPYGNFASHVIGYATRDGGSYGLEQYYNDYLTGTEGHEYGYYDPELNSQKTLKDAIDGYTLTTTLDFNIQTIIQKKIENFQTEIGCNNIGVIVMNPNNGEIYAMASNYEYDLNNPRSLEGMFTEEELEEMTEEEKTNARYKMWRNFCISDTYEPGSTFKTVTVASALEEGVISTGDHFNCDGYTEKGGWRIGCNKKSGHGSLTLAESLMKSCNCALMEIADKLGSNKFFNYQKLFGFGERTGIDLTGEATGIIIPKSNLNVTELATCSFGTTFNVTMIQIAAAYASILNGGDYYVPHVVKEIKTSDGITVRKSEDAPLRETVSKTTSEFIHDALYMTVEAGTATPAKVSGYLIGGKTGTAQKRPRTEKKYVVSFVGFAPADNPQVMTYVVIDEIHDETLAGSSSPATRMTSEIMNDILPYLGMYPEGEIVYNVDLELLQEIDKNAEDEINEGVIPEDYDESESTGVENEEGFSTEG